MGRRRSRRSRSKSKSTKSKSRRRSTAASKRRKVRSVSKAKRAANRSPSKSKTTKKKSRKPSMGRSRHTKGGQHAANKNQNKKARRTVKSVKKAVSKVAKNVGKSVAKATRGLAASAATHVANSKYNKQLKQANWTKRDMSKLTPQQQRKYKRLSEKTGRDYSIRKPTFRLNLNADTLARFGGFADKGWYKGITSRFPGIKKLKINKQFYGNPMKKGWHSSQRTGRGQGLRDFGLVERPEIRRHPGRGQDQFGPGFPRPIRGVPGGRTPDMGPERDWLGDFYKRYNIGGKGGNLDQEARDYWSKEAETKGRTAVLDIIRGTARNQGTWGGMSEADEARIAKIPKGSRTNWRGTIIDRRSARFRTPKRRRPMLQSAMSTGLGLISGGSRGRRAKQKHDSQNRAAQKSYDLQTKGYKRRMAKSLAAHMAATRGI